MSDPAPAQRANPTYPQGGHPRPGDNRHRATRVTAGLLQLSLRLQPRDYTLALLLDEHRVLTTPQIAAVLFASPRTCRNRLDALRRVGFVDRFIPARPGSRPPVHWVAGPLAARYAALARGEPPPTAKALRQRQDAILASPQLEHAVGANQFFVDLLAHARADPGTALLRWWSAARTAAALGRRVRPDGHGVWHEHGTAAGFYLEHDRGTEPIRRLIAKLEPYQRLRRDGGPGYPVLFWLPSTVREANLHARLAGALPTGVPVATAARDTAAYPAEAVWRLAGNGRRRLRLAELPSQPGRPGPYNPGPATADQHPLRLLAGPADSAGQPS